MGLGYCDFLSNIIFGISRLADLFKTPLSCLKPLGCSLCSPFLNPVLVVKIHEEGELVADRILCDRLG